MMNKGRSSRVNLGRYLLAVPVIAGFVLVFTVSRAYEYQAEEQVIVEDSTGSKPPWWSDSPSERLAKRMVRATVDTANAQPLILVDDVVYEGVIKDLDAKAIESVTVLKEKSATEKYGSRGKNGVILIKSKKGQKIQLKAESARKDKTVVDSTERGESRVFPIHLKPIHLRENLADSTKRSADDLIEKLQSSNSTGKQPLLFIDGEEASSDALNNLDKNTITSVSILKDSSATALYGKRGENGVVLITTKAKDVATDLPQKDTVDTLRITGYRTAG